MARRPSARNLFIGRYIRKHKGSAPVTRLLTEASNAFKGHGGMRENPSGNKLLKIGLIAGGAYFGLKWLQSRAAPAPEAKTAA